MTQPAAPPGAPTHTGEPGYQRPLTLIAAGLPPLMSVPASVDPAPYRFPLLQFIWDWNIAKDRAALVAKAPIYDGDDLLLLPAIAVVVHALADRDGVPVPDWVLGHRAGDDVMLFGWGFDSSYARWVRQRSPAVCAYHGVWFHPRTLDKGTPDWWLPWD